ncbi:MAG TPA: hypothetical protein VF992_07515 [Thermoplasmata archaeon]
MADVDWGLIAVFAIAVFFLAWYYGAFLYSRRLAGRIATELKDAVLALGGTSQIRWFGTTAFRMTTEGANAPLRDVSVTVTLRPREMPINWAIGTAQGRRDAALVEASLRVNPRIGFELVDPRTRLGRRRARAKGGWSTVTLGGREWLLSAEDEHEASRLVEALGSPPFEPIMALHVTAGSKPGIAASVSVEKGHAARGLAAIQALAERLAI